MDFLTKFLSGETTTVGESFEYCEEDCNVIDGYGLPLSTLIESVFTDVQMGLIAAEETYELACIVGGTQVITEGSGQEGATLVLEGAIKNFFKTIGEKLSQFWDWIKKMWNKFIGLFKKDGKALNSEFNKVKPAVEKKIEETKNLPTPTTSTSGASSSTSGDDKWNSVPMIPETLVILDPEKGESLASRYAKGVSDVISRGVSKFDDVKNGKTGIFEEFSENVAATLFNKVTGSANIKTHQEFIDSIRSAYGANNTNAKPIRCTNKELAAMEKVIALADDKSMQEYNKGVNIIKKACDDCIAMCDDLANEYTTTPETRHNVQQISTIVTVAGKALMDLVNTRSSIIMNGARSYVSYLKGIANKASALESVDYSVYFESMDIVGEECKPTDEGCDSEDDDEPCEESFNFNNYSGLASFMSV